MTRSECIRLVAVIQAAYPRQAIGDDTIAIYCEMLADLEYPEARAAVAKLVATTKWTPTIAEIREAVFSARVGAEKGGAEAAWLEVRAKVSEHGHTRSPIWSSPLIGEAMRGLGGWESFCASEEPQTILRAQFLKFFEALKNRAVERMNLNHPDAGKALPAPQAPTLRLVEKTEPVEHEHVSETLKGVLAKLMGEGE